MKLNEIKASSHAKEFCKFAKALKNNANWQDKLVESLLMVDKQKLGKHPKAEENHKFKKHPNPIESFESLTSKHEHSDKAVSFLFKTGMSESHSDENVFANEHSLFKTSENIDLQSLPLLEMTNELFSPKNYVEVKSTSKLKNDEVHTVRGTVDKIRFEQKLISLLNNVLSQSEKIRITMDAGITPPDGDEEWDRRYARAKEFHSRFSRNYLYRLGRQVTDLENYYIKCSGRASNRTIENIQQHLIGVCNIVLNALQAYYRHMSTSLAYVALDKLMNIYEHICKCCVIMKKFINRDDNDCSQVECCAQEVLNISNDMVDKLAQILFETPQLYSLTLPAAKLLRKGYKWEVKVLRKKQPIKKTRLDARFSMYSITSSTRLKNSLKRTVEDLAKDKFRYSHVQSRYKTAIFKHRLPIEKPLVNETSNKFKSLEKQSSLLLRNTPLLTPVKEDDIVTMMELEHKREKDVHKLQRSSASLSKERNCTTKQLDVFTPIIQGLCQQICTQDAKNVTPDKLEGLLKNLLGMALDGKINNTKTTPNGTLKYAESIIEQLDLGSTDYQTPTVTPRTPNETNKLQNCNKSESYLNSCVNLIKNTIRPEFQDNEKRKKMKSCTSLAETVENAADCNSKIHLENQHEVVFRDDLNCGVKENSPAEKKKRRQTVSVTGEKNAQLICIRDEDSIIEASEDESAKEIKNIATFHQNDNFVNDVAPLKHKNKHISKDSIKLSRLPKKHFKQLGLLPNTTMCDVIKYKISFKKFSRLNPMYRKSPTIQPWEIVDSISENLLNELLLGVAREIEENDILKNLYESEFC